LTCTILLDDHTAEWIIEDKIAIGGEENAGLSIRHQCPRKRWNSSGLLRAERGSTGKWLAEQLQTISNKVDSFSQHRSNFRLTPQVKTKFTEESKSDPRQFCGQEVSAVVRKDGLKLVFRNGSATGNQKRSPWYASWRGPQPTRARETAHSGKHFGFLRRKQTLEVVMGMGAKTSAFLYFFTSAFRRRAERKV
jgi:hypothetical protein